MRLFQFFLRRYLHGLNQLQQMILLCYIRRDYAEQKYHYEQMLQQWRVRYFRLLKQLRWLAVEPQQPLLDDLTHAYEVVFALTALLYRVTDHNIFTVCEREFRHITLALTRTFDHLYQGEFDPRPLSAAAQGFESLYQSTLRIMSNDPVVFLFYFQNILALGDVLADIAAFISGKPRVAMLPFVQDDL
jgi:hypothetical protein